ncbi:Small-conductance mechanosensitive channel [Gammaproteobacteria bacterium]
MSQEKKQTLRLLATPLMASLAFGVALYLGDETYRLLGVSALESSKQILGDGLGIGFILLATLFLRRLIQYVILDNLVARALGGPPPRMLRQLSALGVYLVAIAAIFGLVLKKDLTVLWAASGVITLVLGMALREMIQDIFSGLALNIDRPVQIGDCVQLHKAGDALIEGRVLEISWRSVRIKIREGYEVIVPNSRFASSTLTNFSRPNRYFNHIALLYLDSRVPPERALRILTAAALEAAAELALPGAIPPKVKIRNLANPLGVEYGVYVPVTWEERSRARTLINQAVLRHLAAAGLTLARPKEEAHSPPAADGDPAWPEPTRILHHLRVNPLLARLPEAPRQHLARHAGLSLHRVGALLTTAGEASSAMYLILEGAVVHRSVGSVPEPLQGPGLLIGAREMLSGAPYGESWIAKTDVVLLTLDFAALGALFAAHPDAARTLCQGLARVLAQESAGSRTANEQDLCADCLGYLRQVFSGNATLRKDLADDSSE